MANLHLCIDCKHHTVTTAAAGNYDEHRCEKAIDVVTGAVIARGDCYTARMLGLDQAPWLCGREGQFFEPKAAPAGRPRRKSSAGEAAPPASPRSSPA